tara:strand:- start:21614 stop:21838 length:225 start_codon:yes stop_codon:yes gene_type:complete
MTVEEITSEVFQVPAGNVQDSCSLSDLSTWDSMSHMVFITRLEQIYEFQMTGDEIAELKTVLDAKNVLEKYGKI